MQVRRLVDKKIIIFSVTVFLINVINFVLHLVTYYLPCQELCSAISLFKVKEMFLNIYLAN